MIILVFMSCAGSKERKPRSLHGRICRRPKLKQQYRNSRFIRTQHMMIMNKRRKLSLDLMFFFFLFCYFLFLVLLYGLCYKNNSLEAGSIRSIKSLLTYRGLVQMKLEKKRATSMDKILNKLRMAEMKAEEMRSSMSGSQANQDSKTSHKVSSFRKNVQKGALGGCFICHAV